MRPNHKTKRHERSHSKPNSRFQRKTPELNIGARDEMRGKSNPRQNNRKLKGQGEYLRMEEEYEREMERYKARRGGKKGFKDKLKARLGHNVSDHDTSPVKSRKKSRVRRNYASPVP
jgi:hypothetical protein